MKKSILIILLGALSFSIFAQEKNKEESKATITTRGTSKISTAPDWVIIQLNATAKNIDYNKAIANLNTQANQLNKAIVMAGFRKEDLNTSSYNIHKNIVWVENKSIDSGYIAQQNFTLEFENNNQKISALIKSLTDNKIDIPLSFGYGLSELKEQQIQQDLLKKAVADATTKATIIASASSVKLKKIAYIQYGQNPGGEISPRMRETMALKNMDSFSGFNAKEIEREDHLTITWEIE